VRIVLAVPGIEPKANLSPLEDLVTHAIGLRSEFHIRHLVSLRGKMQVLVARIQALELADQQIAPFLVEMNPTKSFSPRVMVIRAAINLSMRPRMSGSEGPRPG
jgi:hypothetical protein